MTPRSASARCTMGGVGSGAAARTVSMTRASRRLSPLNVRADIPVTFPLDEIFKRRDMVVVACFFFMLFDSVSRANKWACTEEM